MLAAGKLMTRTGGGGGGVVTMPSGSISAYGSGTQVASVRVANDGKVYTGQQGFFTLYSAWLVSGSNGDFDIRCTVNSGTIDSGATGTWLNLASTRDWSVIDTNDNGVSATANITLQIRDAVSLTVLASGTWQLDAENFGFL